MSWRERETGDKAVREGLERKDQHRTLSELCSITHHWVGGIRIDEEEIEKADQLANKAQIREVHRWIWVESRAESKQ